MAHRIHNRPARGAKARFLVANWGCYNRALVARGAITLWIDEEVLGGWRARSGRGRCYCDVAILAALGQRAVFGLTLRQTQGFLMSLAQMLELAIEVPHSSTFCRRTATLNVPALPPRAGGRPRHLATDATGLKVHGEGEWKMRLHGKAKRRVWRKLHPAGDTRTGELHAHALTASEVHDGAELAGLLAGVAGPVAAVCADKAYDAFDAHAAILAHGARPVIPPRNGAAIRPPPARGDAPPTRDEAGQDQFLLAGLLGQTPGHGPARMAACRLCQRDIPRPTMNERRQSDIMRREGKTFRLAHCLLPVWSGGEIHSASEPGSIAIAFTGQAVAVVREPDGNARPRLVPPMTIGLGGDVPIVWLETKAPSDVLEITGAAELRREMARDMGVESHANLDDLHGWQDPIIQAIMTRLRAALRAWVPMSDLEAETLVRAAYAQALRRHFGGREGLPRTLDARRRQRVLELVRDIGDGPLTLGDLAEAAALSPFHFARSFAKTFGMPPHRFVTACRLERAFHALQSTQATVPQVAAAAGFSNLHHFRQLFRRQYGVPPSKISQQARTGSSAPLDAGSRQLDRTLN